MSLVNAVHEHWKNDFLLNKVLPHTRFYTGDAPNPDNAPVPYAFLMLGGVETQYDSSDVVVENHALQFGIVASTGEEAVDIGEIMQHSIEKADFVLSGTDEHLATYQGQRNLEQNDMGVWVFTADYRVMVARTVERIES